MLRAFAVLLLLATGARAPIKRPHFTDVAPRSSFSYLSNNDFQKRKYFQQPMCGGVGILDYDGDGWMDIFFSNGAKLPELKKTDSIEYHSSTLVSMVSKTLLGTRFLRLYLKSVYQLWLRKLA